MAKRDASLIEPEEKLIPLKELIPKLCPDIVQHLILVDGFADSEEDENKFKLFLSYRSIAKSYESLIWPYLYENARSIPREILAKMRNYSNLLKYKKITKLDTSSCIDKKICESIVCLTKLTDLKLNFRLGMSDTQIMNLTELENLDISGSYRIDGSCFSKLKKLRKLDISFTKIDGKNMEYLSKSLTSLKCNRVSEFSFSFMSLMVLENLTNLDIGHSSKLVNSLLFNSLGKLKYFNSSPDCLNTDTLKAFGIHVTKINTDPLKGFSMHATKI